MRRVVICLLKDRLCSCMFCFWVVFKVSPHALSIQLFIVICFSDCANLAGVQWRTVLSDPGSLGHTGGFKGEIQR